METAGETEHSVYHKSRTESPGYSLPVLKAYGPCTCKAHVDNYNTFMYNTSCMRKHAGNVHSVAFSDKMGH